MNWCYLLPLTFILFASCKGDLEPTIDNCCADRPVGVVAGEMFAPTAYTPNGDGLNDVFRVLPVAYSPFDHTILDTLSFDVRFAFDFKAFQRGKELYALDTIFSWPSRLARSWDFIDRNGQAVVGQIRLDYKIMNFRGETFQNSYYVCLFNCDRSNGKMDFDRCLFEDQVDPIMGFVNSTHEFGCD